MADKVKLVEFNTTSAREYVRENERSTIITKECTQINISKFPLKYFHKLFFINLFFHVVMWLNAMPSNKIISEKYSPRELVTGREMDYTKHCKSIFGAYVESSKYDVVSNNTKPRTHECITLVPSGNIQGLENVIDTLTSRVLKRCKIE